MNIRELRSELETIAVLTGSAKPEDFVGLTAVDIIASYAVSLSGGRLNDEATILGIAQSVQNTRTFINLVSRGSIPVPPREAIMEYLNEMDASRSILANLEKEMPSEPPAPKVPTEKEIKRHYQRIAHGVRAELLNRRDLDINEDEERNRLTNLFSNEIFNEFIARFGSQKYKDLRSGIEHIQTFRDIVMTAKSAEELMDLFEGKSPKKKTLADSPDDEPMVAPMMQAEKPKTAKKSKPKAMTSPVSQAASKTVTTKSVKKSTQQ